MGTLCEKERSYHSSHLTSSHLNRTKLKMICSLVLTERTLFRSDEMRWDEW